MKSVTSVSTHTHTHTWTYTHSHVYHTLKHTLISYTHSVLCRSAEGAPLKIANVCVYAYRVPIIMELMIHSWGHVCKQENGHTSWLIFPFFLFAECINHFSLNKCQWRNYWHPFKMQNRVPIIMELTFHDWGYVCQEDNGHKCWLIISFFLLNIWIIFLWITVSGKIIGTPSGCSMECR